jgi:hypothetical protein
VSVDKPEVVSEEFFLRVNDFLEMANRIERRFDTAHAQMAFLHAFARYGAHHYISTVKDDSAQERGAFADYLGGAVVHLLRHNIDEMRGPAVVAAAGAAPAE